MTLTLDQNPSQYQIEHFSEGVIQINGIVYNQSMLITADNLITNWPPQSILDLTYEHMKVILALQPTLLLLGTGMKLHFPAPSLYRDFINQGIGIEFMTSASAARTYTVLSAEERKVVAAIFVR